MIIVTATLSFASQQDRDSAVEASAAVQKATRDDEPGCHAYCFAADPSEPLNIQVYELWTNADSLRTHFDHPNYAAMVTALQSNGIVNSDNRVYSADDRGTVYDDDGTFRYDAVSDS